MMLIIGLGNPGAKFKNTRHNVGFMAIDKFAEQNSFPVFELNKKANSLVSKKEDILLVKPQTFMNESGKAVAEIIKNKKIESICVVHDDIDLSMGKIKIVKERGSAGHKGVENIIQSIGNEGLMRFRIGIKPEKDIKAEEIVLKNFSPGEQEIINQSIQKTVGALETFINEGLEKTMNEYNK